MRKLFLICISLIALSCNNDQQQKAIKETAATKDKTSTRKKKRTGATTHCGYRSDLVQGYDHKK
jgi:LAS superfamily LD-carboxypeptidase LdcB